MQPQVHFIVAEALEQVATSAQVVLATTLIQHFHQQGLRQFVYCADQAQASQLSNALFAAPLTQFLPHCLSPWRPRNGCPVELGWQPANGYSELFLNLHPQIPEFQVQSRFIVELVPAAPAEREQAREHFRHYRRLGLQPQTHNAATLPQLA